MEQSTSPDKPGINLTRPQGWLTAVIALLSKHPWLTRAKGELTPALSLSPLRTRPLFAARFVGSYDRRPHDAKNGGQSTYNGYMVSLSIDRCLVERVLPPDLRLATTSAPNVMQHPVILLLGHQCDLCWLQNGAVEPARVDPYTELMLVVPYTIFYQGTKWHNYVVRMYLDNQGAVVIGDVYYAYAKEPGIFVEQGAFTSVQNSSTDIVFESHVTPNSAAIRITPGAQLSPGFADLQQVFEMPIVGHFDTPPPPALPGSWRYSCSYFEWDYDNAYAAPVDGQLTFVRPFKPEMQDWVALGAVCNEPDGAFRVTGLRWRLSYELPLWPPHMPPACNFF